jgi:tetratricopeptide (TPR) repeat protein
LNIQQKKSETVGDPVIDGVVAAKKFFEKNGNNIIIGCIAALVIAGGALAYTNMRSADIKKAQELFGVGVLDYNSEQYGKALESFGGVVTDYKNTPVASMSAFMMGSIYLQLNDADQAISFFEMAVNGSKGGFVRAQALEGLATASETKGDAPAAVRYLERALKDNDAKHRHAAIRWKLALLNKDNASAAMAYCNDIVSDTTAAAYHQKAENLIAVLNLKN